MNTTLILLICTVIGVVALTQGNVGGAVFCLVVAVVATVLTTRRTAQRSKR